MININIKQKDGAPMEPIVKIRDGGVRITVALDDYLKIVPNLEAACKAFLDTAINGPKTVAPQTPEPVRPVIGKKATDTEDRFELSKKRKGFGRK